MLVLFAVLSVAAARTDPEAGGLLHSVGKLTHQVSATGEMEKGRHRRHRRSAKFSKTSAPFSRVPDVTNGKCQWVNGTTFTEGGDRLFRVNQLPDPAACANYCKSFKSTKDGWTDRQCKYFSFALFDGPNATIKKRQSRCIGCYTLEHKATHKGFQLYAMDAPTDDGVEVRVGYCLNADSEFYRLRTLGSGKSEEECKTACGADFGTSTCRGTFFVIAGGTCYAAYDSEESGSGPVMGSNTGSRYKCFAPKSPPQPTVPQPKERIGYCLNADGEFYRLRTLGYGKSEEECKTACGADFGTSTCRGTFFVIAGGTCYAAYDSEESGSGPVMGSNTGSRYKCFSPA